MLSWGDLVIVGAHKRIYFCFWATVMVTSLIGTGICMRALAVEGVSAGESLMSRGLACLTVVVLYSLLSGKRLTIQSKKTQLLRAGIAGLALTFYTLSYGRLSASAVSTLSNIDVPLLLVLGPMIGTTVNQRIRLAAVVPIFFLMWFVYGMEKTGDTLVGLIELFVGTVLLCFGYWFIKQSMNEENEAVTIMVPASAITVYGAAEWMMEGAQLSAWNQHLACLALISGVSMFFAYDATMRLYRVTDIATAEFPTLISSILIQPIEILLLGTKPNSTYVWSTLSFITVTYFILNWQSRSRTLSHA